MDRRSCSRPVADEDALIEVDRIGEQQGHVRHSVTAHRIHCRCSVLTRTAHSGEGSGSGSGVGQVERVTA